MTHLDRAPPLDWDAIDVVLLDMDGTLLDLGFDNWFWQEHVPEVWGRERGLDREAALARLVPRFEAARGTLAWYCLDHWSREFGLDLGALKRGVRERVAWIPGAEDFLARLRARGKKRVLVTNAHPETLAIKAAHVDLHGHLDEAWSTHPFGLPKEDAGFWPKLRAATPFDPARTLFVDDSLPVLAAARDYGIAWLRAVRRPDLSRAPRDTPGFAGVDSVAELACTPVACAAHDRRARGRALSAARPRRPPRPRRARRRRATSGCDRPRAIPRRR